MKIIIYVNGIRRNNSWFYELIDDNTLIFKEKLSKGTDISIDKIDDEGRFIFTDECMTLEEDLPAYTEVTISRVSRSSISEIPPPPGLPNQEVLNSINAEPSLVVTQDNNSIPSPKPTSLTRSILSYMMLKLRR